MVGAASGGAFYTKSAQVDELGGYLAIKFWLRITGLKIFWVDFEMWCMLAVVLLNGNISL